MVYVRRGELRVAYVWKLLRNTDARVCVCGAPRSLRLCSLLSEALGGPSWESLESLLVASWAPLGSLLGRLRASWEALGALKGTLRALAHEF